MSAVEITSLSSKGQIVIPSSIRNDLKISAGDKFAIISDGENILLRPVEKPKIDKFRALIAASIKYARENALQKEDVVKAVKRVRRENRS